MLDVVVVVGGRVVVVVVVVVDVVVVVVVVGGGTFRSRRSRENPRAAWSPAAEPMPSGNEATVLSNGCEVDDEASLRASLGENAAKAATANNAMTTQVANANSRVNLTYPPSSINCQRGDDRRAG